MDIQFDATAGEWHVITGSGNLVRVLFRGTREECEMYVQTEAQ